MPLPIVTELLFNHTSPETAFIVPSYPYGFRLRCKIRYWLEFKANKGFRFVSQTTDPRRAVETWNKSKASTYCKFGGAMYLDEKGHVEWSGLHEYMGLEESRAWVEQFGAAVPEIGQAKMKLWMGMKENYEKAKQKGLVTCQVGNGPVEVLEPEIKVDMVSTVV